MTEYCEIKKLVELFNECNKNYKDDDEEDDLADESEETTKLTPSGIGKNEVKEKAKNKKKVNPYSKIEPKPRENKEVLDPYDEKEFLEETEVKDLGKSDWRKTPKWDISYRQQVTASDVFLGMGMKTPSTSSCDEMIVKIHLPEEKRQNMDLKILKTKLVLCSPRFYLDLDLPQPVDPKRGNAQYDKNEETLTVILKMDRDLDVLNL